VILKILQLNTNFRPGGIQRHILDLSDWLRARGHVVHLGGTPGPWAGPELTEGFLEVPTREVSWEGGAPHKRARALAVAVPRLRHFVKKNGIELVHSHESAPALVARLALVGTGVKQVVTYHGSAPDRIGQYAKISRSADLVLTPSHASASDLCKIGGLPNEKVKVLGLGLRPPKPSDPEALHALREDLLGDGRQLVVVIARITRQKGIDILIDVVARMKQTHPHVRFALVGPGPDEAAMKALAGERGVGTHLTFVGATDRPHDYLRAADLFLLTSRWESLPFTIQEAFQVGTPTVATACSGVVELIDDTVGRVAPIGDVPAIARAVAEVLENDTMRAAMAAAALERSCEDRFNPDWVHDQFEKIYTSVIGQA
jgi:glycosyltransferase involved in cell wall biosynthesis